MSFELNIWFSSRFRKTRELNGRFGLGFTKLLERTELNRTFTTLVHTHPLISTLHSMTSLLLSSHLYLPVPSMNKANLPIIPINPLYPPQEPPSPPYRLGEDTSIMGTGTWFIGDSIWSGCHP